MIVDEITEGFEDLQLDHPTGEGETRLGLALKTPCLWRKELIKLPNWTTSSGKRLRLGSGDVADGGGWGCAAEAERLWRPGI